MYRKLVIASAILAMSSSVAFAANYKGDYKGEAGPAPCPTYVYATGPYVGLSIGPITNYTGTPVVYKGFSGNINAGYGMLMNPAFYLAAEIFAQSSATIKNYKDELTGTNGVKTTWGYGLDIIPGYMITDHVLGYVRAGVIRSRFSTQGVNATGWRVGLGGQTNIWQNWDLRGEYVYNGYQSVSGIGKPGSDQFNLGLVYKFV